MSSEAESPTNGQLQQPDCSQVILTAVVDEGEQVDIQPGRDTVDSLGKPSPVLRFEQQERGNEILTRSTSYNSSARTNGTGLSRSDLMRNERRCNSYTNRSTCTKAFAAATAIVAAGKDASQQQENPNHALGDFRTASLCAAAEGRFEQDEDRNQNALTHHGKDMYDAKLPFKPDIVLGIPRAPGNDSSDSKDNEKAQAFKSTVCQFQDSHESTERNESCSAVALLPSTRRDPYRLRKPRVGLDANRPNGESVPGAVRVCGTGNNTNSSSVGGATQRRQGQPIECSSGHSCGQCEDNLVLASTTTMAFDVELVDEAAIQRRVTERVREQLIAEAVQAEVITTMGTQQQQQQRSRTRTTAASSITRASLFLSKLSVRTKARLGAVALAFMASVTALIVFLALYCRDDAPSRKERLMKSMGLDIDCSSSRLSNNETMMPQCEALHWMAEVDTAQYPIDALSPDRELIQRYALAVMYFSTAGWNWITTNVNASKLFLSESNVCDWHGVRCGDGDSNIVDGVFLYNMGLRGTIPNEICDLRHLEVLSLFENNIEGTLPTCVGTLSRLRALAVFGNLLTGTIPSTLSFLPLTHLDVYSNMLSGTLSGAVLGIPSLEWLDAAENMLTGTLPHADDKKQLTYLWLDGNRFEGTIPESFGKFTYLERLHLSQNRLTGSIPSELKNLANIRQLHLHGNQLNGTIPFEIRNLENVRELDWGQNHLSGTIPSEMGEMWNLEFVGFAGNELTGRIPSELGDLFDLRDVWLNNNQLTGLVPTSFSQLKQLVGLRLQNNSLTGDFDSVFCHGSNPLMMSLEADCDGNYTDIQCSCCTRCCDDISGQCNDNNEARCAKAKHTLEASRSEYQGTLCSCYDGGDVVSCIDTSCRYCTTDDRFCFQDVYPGYGFSFELVEGQWVRSAFSHIRFVNGSDWQVSMYDHGTNNTCSASLNGQECSACARLVCSDGYVSRMLDCNNVVAGARIHGCDESRFDSPLTLLVDQFEDHYWGDSDDFQRQSCSPQGSSEG